MNQVITFVENHWGTFALAGAIAFKTAVNALPPAGEPFSFSQWFMEWMRELGQQTPLKLSPQQTAVLKNAGIPAAK